MLVQPATGRLLVIDLTEGKEAGNKATGIAEARAFVGEVCSVIEPTPAAHTAAAKALLEALREEGVRVNPTVAAAVAEVGTKSEGFGCLFF